MLCEEVKKFERIIKLIFPHMKIKKSFKVGHDFESNESQVNVQRLEQASYLLLPLATRNDSTLRLLIQNYEEDFLVPQN